jgi:DNA anti-recombination protein RmuC
MVGAPLPFPSLIDVSSAHVAFVNFLSLLVTLVGSIIGIGFYIERRNNLKFDAQNHKMDRIDQKIDSKAEWIHNELRDMETRICRTFDEKMKNIENTAEYKLQKAKDIEDERFRRIDEGHREHERRLDRIDQTSYSDYGRNRTQRKTDEHNWDVKSHDG